jgi:hypothetical protein
MLISRRFGGAVCLDLVNARPAYEISRKLLHLARAYPVQATFQDPDQLQGVNS